MEDDWLSIKHIEAQEFSVQNKTEELFGKGRKGFCGYTLNGIDLMIHGVSYLKDIIPHADKDKYNDFNHALRVFSNFHYHRIVYTFKAAYNLYLQGYYTESAYLVRHILETYVRLRYIAKKEDIELVNLAFAGYRGDKGKKFKIPYEAQFNFIAPGLYKSYRTLCDISHGSLASHIFKIETSTSGRTLEFDTGLVFKAKLSTYISNQMSVYLLAHLEFMVWIFPEIKKKMSEKYAEKYYETLKILWGFMKDISEKEQNENWYKSVKSLVKI